MELKEIHTGIKDFSGLLKMDSLKQIDFRFIDHSKGRIAAMRRQMTDAGKEHLLYENIPEEQRIPSMAHVHLSKFLMEKNNEQARWPSGLFCIEHHPASPSSA